MVETPQRGQCSLDQEKKLRESYYPAKFGTWQRKPTEGLPTQTGRASFQTPCFPVRGHHAHDVIGQENHDVKRKDLDDKGKKDDVHNVSPERVFEVFNATSLRCVGLCRRNTAPGRLFNAARIFFRGRISFC